MQHAGTGLLAASQHLSALWTNYNVALAQQPLLVKVITGIVGATFGDFIAQYLSYLSQLKSQLQSSLLPITQSSSLNSNASNGSNSNRKLSDDVCMGSNAGLSAAGTQYSYLRNLQVPNSTEVDLEVHLLASQSPTFGHSSKLVSPNNSGISNVGGKGGVSPSQQQQQHVSGVVTFRYDIARLLRLCAVTAFVGTPIAHVWFGFLDQTVYPLQPTSAAAVVCKLALDQLVMAPIGIALFFYANKLLETSGDWHAARQEVSAKIRPTLVANYMVWPAANLINFRFVPPEQRILYVNIVALLWTAVLSHIASQKTGTFVMKKA